MGKIIICILIVINILNATNDISIKDLQNQFNEEVHTLNIFKTRYGKYLRKHCADDLICYKKTIQKLQTWKMVQNDKKLKNLFAKQLFLYHCDINYFQKLQKKLQQTSIILNRTQFISVVDLNLQLFTLLLWDNDSKQYYWIGKDYISSGNIRREFENKKGDDHYFKTPNGVFKLQSGWRSEGKHNSTNKVFGYGYKNRYIFYFGEQQSIRYNVFDKNGTKYNNVDDIKLITGTLDFALHAHKSSKPMGEPNSHGCIRTTDELDRFLDNYYVLHYKYIKNGSWSNKYATKPLDNKYKNIAGEYLVVFNKL